MGTLLTDILHDTKCDVMLIHTFALHSPPFLLFFTSSTLPKTSASKKHGKNGGHSDYPRGKSQAKHTITQQFPGLGENELDFIYETMPEVLEMARMLMKGILWLVWGYTMTLE